MFYVGVLRAELKKTSSNAKLDHVLAFAVLEDIRADMNYHLNIKGLLLKHSALSWSGNLRVCGIRSIRWDQKEAFVRYSKVVRIYTSCVGRSASDAIASLI